MAKNVHGGVRVERDVILKPCSSHDATTHPYLRTIVPLTIFDLAAVDDYPSILFAFPAPTPDNAVLVDVLARTLFHYPTLAGTLTTVAGWPCVKLDDHGIRLIETRVNSRLDAHFPFDPSSDLVASLVPNVVSAQELCYVQLNRFSCGGQALGFAFHHKVADGRANSSFLSSWAQMTGVTRASVLPASVHMPLLPMSPQEQSAVFPSREPPRCLFPHAETEFLSRRIEEKNRKDLGAVAASIASMKNVRIHYSNEFVARLKANVHNGSNHIPPDTERHCTTVQCVLAHVWKNITAARRVDPKLRTCARIAVNGRSRLTDPPVPASYFGNLVLWAFAAMTAEDLLAASYSEVVGVIRDAVAKMDETYFRSFINFGELVKRREATAPGKELVPSLPESGDVMCPDIEVNSWLGLDFEKLAFGCGRTSGVMPANLPIEGLIILVPSSVEDGAVDVCAAVKRDDAPLFTELSSLLD